MFTRGYVTITALVTPDDAAAQHAFWGQGAIVQRSMLHQLALRLAA